MKIVDIEEGKSWAAEGTPGELSSEETSPFLAGFQLENPIARWMLSDYEYSSVGEWNPDYQFENDPNNEGYPPSLMARAINEQDAARLRANYDEEIRLRSEMASSWKGLAGAVAGGLLQPHVVGAMFASPGTGLAMTVLGDTASEALLQKQQEERTMAESALVIGLGATGAAISFIWKGSGKVVGQTAEKVPEDAPLTPRIFPTARILEPAWQTVMNSESTTAKELFKQMAEMPVALKSHLAGVPGNISSESRALQLEGRATGVIRELQRIRKDHGLKPDDVTLYIRTGETVPGKKEALEKAASLVKRYFGEFGNVMARVGIPSIDGYIPRVYSPEKIARNYNALLEEITSWVMRATEEDLGRDEATEIARTIVRNMQGGDNIAAAIPGGTPSFLRKRVIDLEDKVLAPYLENDMETLVSRHAHSVAPYIAWKERIPEDAMKMVSDDYAAAIERARNKYGAGSDKAVKEERRLRLERERVLGALQRSRDFILHYHHGESLPVRRALSTMGAINIASQLGGIVLSSIPDLGRIIGSYGGKASLKAFWKKLPEALQGGQKLSRQELDDMAVALERTLNARLLSFTTETDSSALGQKLWHGLAKWSGFDVWTDTVEEIAANGAHIYVQRLGRKVAAGKKLGQADKTRLAQIGITEQEAKEIAALGDRPIYELEDELAYRYLLGIGADVRRTIVRATAADRIDLLEGPWGRLVFQYWQFGIGMTSRLLSSVLAMGRTRDLKVLEGMFAMLALGMGVEYLKATIRGKELEWDEAMVGAIDRSGILGIYGDTFNKALAIANKMGIPAPESSKYALRDPIDIAGPTVSTLTKPVRAAGYFAAGDWDKGVEQLWRVLPYNDLWNGRTALGRLLKEQGYENTAALLGTPKE